jgi:serine/threonine protein kinase/tetratricopeptide (TPR) repeat protein
MSRNLDEAKSCFVCGTPLPGVDEPCPVCMLRKALTGGVESGEFSTSEETIKATPEQATRRFEHYELVPREDGKPVELGRGAMGITYRAFDTVLRHAVALKVIDARIAARPEARERFLREARAAARLRHPNVASVFYYGVRKSDGQCFYAMELVEGETLEARLRRGPLPVAPALEVVAQVARALVAAEAQELVHRDLKPANLMLVEGPELSVKVIDFGLARAVVPAKSETDLTHGGFVGTPAFASPEQFTGTQVDIRSDLYSLGVILWEMLTGQTPFRGSPAEVMDLNQREPLPLEQLKRVPQPVVALLEVLLENDPARRLQSPADLLKALAKVTDAVKARRSITRQGLRQIADQRLGVSGKALEILSNLRSFISHRRSRMILWPVLVIGAALVLVNIVFGPKDHAPQVSKGFSSIITTPEKSIAVLPFESLSDSKSDSYFADGVQDEILSNLAKVSQLKVISRTSVMTYRSANDRNLRSIANALGVANVVEGTVRRDGSRVRVTTELVDARTDQTLWSDSYDRNLSDIFAIQSEIAETVASKLSARLSPQEKQGIQEKPTENSEAYDLYLQAKALITGDFLSIDFDKTRRDVLDAISFAEQATRLDPSFALAYCQIAKASDGLCALRIDVTPTRRVQGDAAVEQALRLKPNLPEAHLAAALHLYTWYRDYEKARAHLAIAERALPNSSETLWLAGYIDRGQGRWAESTKAYERACNLDPENQLYLRELSANYGYLRRYRDQDRIYRRLIALAPENPSVKLLIAIASFEGNADLNAWHTTLEALPSSMKNDPDMVASLFGFLIFSREWMKLGELIRSSPSEELPFNAFNGGAIPMVPRGCLEIQLAKYQGENPELNAQFGIARNQLFRKVGAHPEDPYLLIYLGQIDAYLNRKQEAIEEAKRALEMLPDAIDGPILRCILAGVYAQTKEPDLAFQELDISVKTPRGVSYGDLKLDPEWDPIRTDPRFEELLAQLAPRD